MKDREEALATLAKEFAAPIGKLVAEIEKMLAGLALAPHFDPTDPSALGSAIHSALPNAVAAADIGTSGWAVKTVKAGPGNKLACTLVHDGTSYDVSLEVHLSGPRGGVGKTAHQFAAADGMTSYLPGFEIEAPASFLLFLGLFLDATCTRVVKAHLMYADNIDRRCVAIDLPSPSGSAMPEGVEPAPKPAKAVPGSKVKIKKTAEEKRDAGSKDQRGDGSSGS